jgi:hypothetical protein
MLQDTSFNCYRQKNLGKSPRVYRKLCLICAYESSKICAQHMGQTEYVLPEDGNRIQSPKRCFLKINKMTCLDKNMTMDNVKNIMFVSQLN